jgi:tetratricopeptide (TPR) repeat protein
LRRAFIEQLIDDQRYADAVKQYELLDKADPNNPDYLRDWGKLILRDTSRPKPQRLAAAEKVWRKLLAARPKDPLAATQVADLLRHAEMQAAALELYEKAVALAPDQPQYREYLGEFYHQLKRSEDALATWRKIADGKNRTAANLARLAEVFASFGYLQEAVPEMAAACQLDPKDFTLQVKNADLLEKLEQHGEALAALDRAAKLAQNDEEREAVLTLQLRIYETEQSLARRTAELAEATKAGDATPRQLFLLARLHEASRQLPEAAQAIAAALKLEPQSIPSLAAAARIQEQSGELQAAADLNRRLASADRRGRSDYLRHVAELEAQLGQIDEALAAGRELITSAPGNTENYEFYATLCFRLGKADDGLQALRRAMRLNPGEPQLILTLAGALAEQFRTDEAIELYWQAYDKGQALDDKLGVVIKLTDLHLQSNHLDQLLDRLERQRRDADDKRESTICLSQAYNSAGDYGMARQELESLLNDNTRDTQLLQQLSKLAETEGDLTNAVKYQEQLAKLAPGPESEYRLATLLAANGAPQESAAILVRLATREEDPEKLLRTIDSLLGSEQHETARLILDSKRREEPKNWELLYREGVALAKSSPQEAAQRFEQILALPNDDFEPGIVEKSRRAKEAKTKATATVNPRYAVQRELSRIDNGTQIRIAAGLLSREYYGGGRMMFWGPSRYSDARMAALAWLYRFARDEKQADPFVERWKKAADAESATSRALWDYLYLQAVSGGLESVANYEALRPLTQRLAAQGDLSGQYLFLTLLSYRRPEYRGNSQGEPLPLNNAEIELALQSHEALRKWSRGVAQGDEMLSYLSTSLMGELKRAGRIDDEQRLFRELVVEAKQPDQIAYAISTYVARDDMASALVAFDKWARLTLQNTRKGSSPSYSEQVGQSISRAIGRSGAAKNDAEVLALLDRYLDFNTARSAQERLKASSRTRRRTANSSGGYYYIWYGKQQHNVQARYPLPNEYLDQASLNVLRNAYEIYLRNDVASDLVRHLQERLAASTPADKLYHHLALAYVAWWGEDKETAVQQLTAASELASQDWQLRLEVARFHTETQDFESALALVDAINPLDQDTLRERETMALNLAVRLGDHDRARGAAERLFGLRLDAETQIQLANQMRRLGMNDQAEAVLARAQRQAGSRLGALVSLMSAHQSQGRPEIAAQIAYQVLRRSRTPAANSSRGGGVSSDESSRRSALQVLASAGKLKEMITVTEAQLERAPQASQLFDLLAEYYEAAGQADKSLELQKKLVEQRPDDMDLGYRYAQRLAQAGKHSLACDQYLVVVKKHPQLFGNRSYEIVQTFQQAQRQADLIALFNAIDIRQLGQPYSLVDVVQNLMRDKAQRPAAMGLFKKVWEALPEYRPYLMSSMSSRDDLFEDDELFILAKQSLVPSSDAVQQQGAWIGLSDSVSITSGGTTYSTFQGIMAHAAKTNQLQSLRDHIAAAIAAHPEWKAGPLMLATIDLKLNKPQAAEDARAVIERALEGKDDNAIPYYARWILGQLLEENDPLRDLVIRLYEGALSEEYANSRNEFQYTPGPRLIDLYVAANRRDEAKALLIKSEKQNNDQGYDSEYAAQQRISQLLGVAQQYERLDFSVDALRLYRESLLAAQNPILASRNYGNTEYYVRSAQQQLRGITARLAVAENPALMQTLLAPRNEPGKPVVDLMLVAQSDRSGSVRIESPLVELLMAPNLSTGNRAAMAQQIAALVDKYPDDLSLRIIAALGALRDKDAARMAAALTALRQVTEKSPLEPLAQGQRANSRQREAAQRQIPLWLVAAEYAKHPAQQVEVDFLAARAVEAARRQSDPQFATGILTQQSQSALATGDKPAAERHLTALLDFALTRPQVKKKPPGETPEVGPAKAELIPPVTLRQFRLAMQVAHMAVENDLPQLAARAATESLSGGLPVADDDQGLGGSRSGRIIRSSSGEMATGEESEIGQTVSTELSKLSQSWRLKNNPPQLMYDMLHGIVFPPTQAGMVLLYPQRLDNWSQPRSLGLELVRWSVALGQGEDLAKELEQRSRTPSAEHSSAVLRVSLAIEQKQFSAAVEPLRALAKALEQPRASVLAAASQAAAVAFSHKELTSEALPILEAVARSPQTANSSNQQSLLLLLGRHYIARGQVAPLRDMYEHYLQTRQSYYARYGDSESAMSVQRSDLAQVVAALSRAGDVELTLEFLGRYNDVPATAANDASSPLWDLDWQLRSLPAPRRYDLLKQWTLPTEKRRTVRFMAAASPGLQTPAAFVPENRRSWSARPQLGLISNFGLLVQAAGESQQFDDLQIAADQAVADKLQNAEALSALVALARQAPAARDRVQSMADATAKMIAQPPEKPRERHWEELRWQNMLVLEAAYANPATRKSAQRWAPNVLKECRSLFDGFDRLTHLSRIIALDSLRDLPDAEREALLTPGLAYWTPGTPPGLTNSTNAPAWWTAHGDTITHLTGFEQDNLYFNYPLAGTFEFSFESHSYDFSEAEIAYGGLVSVPEFWTNRALIWPVSRHETVTRGNPVVAKDWWNRYSVQVSPQAIRFFSNGHLVYEESEPSATSPWLHLATLDHRRVTVRRLKLSGAPEVPREVRLVDADRFEGWSGTQYYDQLPNRLTQREPARVPNPNESVRVRDARPDSWYADQGVLHGRREINTSDRNQSRLSYHRPLRSGDTLSYEFFYEPEKTHVHPCLGRLVFLLEPAGARLHWSTDGVDLLGLEPDNAIDEPEQRRGGANLPLNAGDWNSLQVAIAGKIARLTLNGQLVYEQPLEPSSDLRFGLFHYRDQTEVQVRNVVLRGDWPEKVGPDVLANLLKPASPQESPALARARHSLTREAELADDVYQVWRDARSLPAAERYARLREWVLPGPAHPTYRLQAEFTPADAPLSTAREAIGKLKASRSHPGGELISPAWELVRTAAELKKLDELSEALPSGVRDAPEGARNLLALQIMLAVARGDDNAALAAIKMLHAQLLQLDPATPEVDRYPELLAVYAASTRLGLRKEILPLAEVLVENQHSHHVSPGWERTVRWLRAQVRWQNDPLLAKLPLGGPPRGLTQWSVVSHPTAEQRGRGLPAPTWSYSRGNVGFHTGQGNDSLYFQSPLTGDFEVTCRRTTFGWKEIRLMYGALAFDVHYEGKALLRAPLGRGATTLPLPAKIENWGEQVDYRLAVKDGQMTVLINGKQVHSERLTVGVDPWLAIQTASPHFNGSVQNLRITGSPVIPQEIDITASPDLFAWRADYYGDSSDAPEALWTRRKEEIVGNLHENAPVSMRESVLQYHRPLVEDGEIEYEFFYEPGKTEVHPALDRAALLIVADGVKRHYLTDGAYDRSGLDPANAAPLAGGSSAPPLRADQWNKLQLQLQGSMVSLTLNGEPIGQYELEPTNQRLFGLFRYSDATGCRVRNVKYRGAWPKTLPPPEEQELSAR